MRIKLSNEIECEKELKFNNCAGDGSGYGDVNGDGYGDGIGSGDGNCYGNGYGSGFGFRSAIAMAEERAIAVIMRYFHKNITYEN